MIVIKEKCGCVYLPSKTRGWQAGLLYRIPSHVASTQLINQLSKCEEIESLICLCRLAATQIKNLFRLHGNSCGMSMVQLHTVTMLLCLVEHVKPWKPFFVDG